MRLVLIYIILSLYSYPALLASEETERLDSLETALKEFNPSDTSEKHLYILYDLGIEWLHSFEDYNKSIYYMTMVRDLAIKAKNRRYLIDAETNLGDNAYWLSNFPEAIEHFFNALDYTKIGGTSEDSAYIFRQIGYVYYHIGKLEKAYDYYLKSLKIGEALQSKEIIGSFHYADALLDMEQNKLPSALKKLKKSLAIATELESHYDISDCTAVIGDVYHMMDSLELAIKYKQKSLKMDTEGESQYGIAYCNHSLGETYLKMNKLEKALELFLKSLEGRQKLHDRSESIQSLNSLGDVYSKMGQHDLAFQYLNQALDLAQEMDLQPALKDVYEKFAEVYSRSGYYKKAFEYQKMYHELKDTLFNQKTVRNLANLHSSYEVEQKEHTIDILRKEQRISSLENEKSVSRLQNVVLISTTLFLLVLGFLGYYQLRKQFFYNRKLKEKQDKISNQNKKLTTANEKMGLVNKELKQFAYVVSHDLKAPLRAISTLGTFIEEDLGDDINEDVKENITLLKGRITRMENLIQGILEYSRVQRKEVEKEWIDLALLLEEISASVALRATDSGVSIQLPESLPKIYASQTLLHQVLQNLLSNAVKYNDKPHCIIEVKFQESKTHLQFAIKDNGPGIPEKYHQKIFEIFQTLQARDTFESTGVGLSIVKKIVEDKASGKIWLESEPGLGSTFFFTWKKDADHSAEKSLDKKLVAKTRK